MSEERAKFIRWYIDTQYPDEMLATHVWDNHHITAKAWRAALAAAPARSPRSTGGQEP